MRQERLADLRSLQILDTAPEERFDRITRLMSRMFRVPMAFVSLVDSDRQWFKSSCGLKVLETPRAVSFCGHAILSDEMMVVEDALADERFRDNPIVTGPPRIRFYAGAAAGGAWGAPDRLALHRGPGAQADRRGPDRRRCES